MKKPWRDAILLGWACLAVAGNAGTSGALPVSRVIEAAGLVEFRTADTGAWQFATNGLNLHPGDFVRTGPASRAAIQFSDRSVMRLGERSTLEIQPPRHGEQRRFRWLRGRLFFFNRERPAEVEFETPVAAGAIRGTEFVLETDEATGATRLWLLDGRVELAANGITLQLRSGEAAEMDAGQPPRATALLEAASIIQWALYYPAVLNPGDLALTRDDETALADALSAYRAGDLVAAAATSPGVSGDSPARQVFGAALDLAVGRLESAEQRLALVRQDHPVRRALREMIDTVLRGSGSDPAPTVPATASEWLARSYALQARFQLHEAHRAARHAQASAPELGFVHVRAAELAWALELRSQALADLDRALACSPRLAQAHALRGFILLEQHDDREALVAFEQAVALDPALGSAWLGCGLAELRLGRRTQAVRSFQAAVAMEPRRALHRSYLGKAWSQEGESALAEKEFRLAKDLDPADPTAWLYSALHVWQQNRPNAAVRDLEHSTELNGNRRLFRSNLRLDRDQAVRSAHLAALYRDAGLAEVSLRSAARAVNEDYANYSGHLFLADSYRALEDPNRFDLRFETVRQTELLVANLLAPAGAANLSQGFSQQDHLQFFNPRSLNLSTFTEYQSTGAWRERASWFGAEAGFSYALDVAYDWQPVTEVNNWRERLSVSAQTKHRLTGRDEVYLQIGASKAKSGDVARHYDPADANPTLRVTEEQLPALSVGWHHAWNPGSHTLLLVSRVADTLNLQNSEQQVLFLRYLGGTVARVSTDAPGFALDYQSDFAPCSTDLQQVWQTEDHSWILGGRLQTGDIDTAATLSRDLTGVVSDQDLSTPFQRAGAYAYWNWQVLEPLQVVTGLSYEHLQVPVNHDTVPLTSGDTTHDLLAPKAGLLLVPWKQGLIRAGFSRSLGGLYFDNSLRLEPTQVAGFNQAYRSLLPESVGGVIPGMEFETVGLGFDQSLPLGLYFGAEAQWLASQGDRRLGALTNSSVLPVPDSISSTTQEVDYREQTLSVYAVQLLGDGCAAGVRYRRDHASLDTSMTDIPRTALGLEQAEQQEDALLHQVQVSLDYQHTSGWFARWESAWYHQENEGYTPGLPGDTFWQHNVWAGWKLPRRRLELRVGILNLTDTDYRLNPLNPLVPLPRERTAVVSLRLNL